MPWLPAIIERFHEIQNPSSPEKIRLMAEAMKLGPDAKVLDLAGGRGGPAVLLARDFGCQVTTIDWFPEFTDAAKTRAVDAGVGDRVEVLTGDASSYQSEGRSFDAVLCLGATFVFGGLDGSLDFMIPLARDGGHVAVGEPYDRGVPLPSGVTRDEHWPSLSLTEVLERLADKALRVVGVVPSSTDDWDRYESLHLFGLQEWLDANPSDPEAAALAGGHRASLAAFARQREMGWAIAVGRKAS